MVRRTSADLVAALNADGKARESIRKTVTALAMVFDHAGMTPNPARDRVIVKLPREDSEEPNPPSAEQVEAVYWTLPSRHQLGGLRRGRTLNDAAPSPPRRARCRPSKKIPESRLHGVFRPLPMLGSVEQVRIDAERDVRRRVP
jgi:hypothetical protein